MKRTPINKVSRKRAKQNRERTKVLKQLGKGKALCERCGQRKATDGHELLPRSAGGSITDPNNIKLLCRPCHQWVTENTRSAMAEGFYISRFKGNAPGTS